MAKPSRLGGLRRFAFAITFLNILGHSYLGFEQSWLLPLAAVAAAYFTETVLEWLTALNAGRAPRFSGGPMQAFDFLLSAHISGLAISMLLYPGERIAPVVFATVVAIASKYLVRVSFGEGRTRHVFNPSNLGITATLIFFPWVGIAQPYMFTENLYGWADWILPAIIIVSGSFLNARYTGRMALIVTWLLCFAAQAGIRSLFFDLPPMAGFVPITGVAFLLFTFYMVTDPATTPISTRGQIAFGAGVAAAYGLLMTMHIVFGLFFALTAVCTVRALALSLPSLVRGSATSSPLAPATAPRRA
ncbi:MAG: RnfABCDGE type electron transport complex subunit D [Acidobacteriota bacterium]